MRDALTQWVVALACHKKRLRAEQAGGRGGAERRHARVRSEGAPKRPARGKVAGDTARSPEASPTPG
eukprot:4253533-Pyramimonas_sp.AAC.1